MQCPWLSTPLIMCRVSVAGRRVKKKIEGKRETCSMQHHLIAEFVRLAYPHIVEGASVEVVRDAVRDRMPPLPDEIITACLITMQTVINIGETRTSKDDPRSDQLQKTRRVEDEKKDEEVFMETGERKEEREASPGSSARRTAASEERSRILASVPVLLTEDPEFEEFYSSAAFNPQQAASTVSKETPRPAEAPIASPAEVVAVGSPGRVDRVRSKGVQEDAAAGRRIQVQKLTGKRLYKGKFRIKKSSRKQPEATRTSIIRPPMIRRPSFPPQLVAIETPKKSKKRPGSVQAPRKGAPLMIPIDGKGQARTSKDDPRNDQLQVTSQASSKGRREGRQIESPQASPKEERHRKKSYEETGRRSPKEDRREDRQRPEEPRGRTRRHGSSKEEEHRRSSPYRRSGFREEYHHRRSFQRSRSPPRQRFDIQDELRVFFADLFSAQKSLH